MARTAGHQWSESHWFNRGPAVAAFLTLLALALFLSALLSSYESALIFKSRSDVNALLDPHCEALSLAIANRLSLLHGLKAFVETAEYKADTGMEKGFPRFASVLCEGIKGIRNVAISPGGVQRYVFPLEGNEKALGLNLFSDRRPGVAESIQRALDTRKVVLAGPYELVTGGLGFVGRLALFNEDVFWGMVSTAVEISPLLESAGFDNLPGQYIFAIRRQNAEVFFGRISVFENDPVVISIHLPGESWEVGVQPINGWHSAVRPSLLPVKAAGVLVIMLLSGIVYLVGSRQVSLARAVEARTEELAASEELFRTSEERFRLLVENAPDSIHVQTGGLFAYVNPAAMKLLGASSEDQLLGRSVMDTLHHSYHEEVRNRIHLVNVEKRLVPTSEQKFIRLDGSIVDVEVLSVPITYENQDGSLVLVRDISERKRAEEERERLEAQLRRNQKLEAIGTLAGGIAHDFNNILAAIIGYSEMSTLDLSQNNLLNIGNNLDQILRASLRAKDLVRQILVLSRQGSGRETSVIDTKPLVKEAVNLLRASLPSTIEIVLNVQSERAHTLADPSQIHQVLMNLCTNAAHAMEESGGFLRIDLVDVELDSLGGNAYPELGPGSYVKLTVSDTGCGMDSKNLDRIFDPYFTTKEIGKGTGLGLAVVHGIVKRHKGAIAVRSKKGSGSTFDVLLPRADSKSEEEKNVGRPVPTGTERILFVDDEEPLVDVGKMMLESLGYRVIATNSSGEALKLFQLQPDLFDLVVTDYTMPEITGADLAKRIIEVRPDIPVIMCTGYSEQISEEKAKALGVKGFLMKPLSRQDLAEKVREALHTNQISGRTCAVPPAKSCFSEVLEIPPRSGLPE